MRNHLSSQVHKIMRDPSGTKQDVIARQERMLRLAERDHDLTLKVLSAETGIPLPTLTTWKRDVAMPAWALVCLSRVIPDELVSLLFEPAGKFVASVEPGEGDLDALARIGAEYNVEYIDAHHPASEAGTGLSPREVANLKDRARRIAGVAQRAAA